MRLNLYLFLIAIGFASCNAKKSQSLPTQPPPIVIPEDVKLLLTELQLADSNIVNVKVDTITFKKNNFIGTLIRSDSGWYRSIQTIRLPK